MARKSTPTVTREELLDEGADAEFRVLVHDLLAFSARIGAVESGLGNLIGMTQTQFRIVMSTAYLQASHGVGVNALAEHLHFSGAFVTSEVNKLVSNGTIEKTNDPVDRRRVRLKLTAAARRHLEDLKKFQAPVNDVLFSSITRDEFVMLRSVMSRLVSHGDEALALLDFYSKTERKEAV
ncbi:MarR family winged helix-turn-helix transcriptional regulator [Caballeronia sp. LjRoot34]|uniref:MarR family winged helix-turn-helix transcriptional regulator n=1 Tax=Caballeronia sp. LjRoot34 TaxID=3342325 RepID=UPI003ECDB1F5